MSRKWMSEGAACKALGLKEWELVGLLDTEKLEYKEGERGEIWVSAEGVRELGTARSKGSEWSTGSKGVTSKTGFPTEAFGNDDLSTRERRRTAEYDYDYEYEYEYEHEHEHDSLGDRLISEKKAAGVVGVTAGQLGKMAREGKIRRVDRPTVMATGKTGMGPKSVVVRWWYWLQEVEGLRDAREELRERRSDPKRRISEWGNRGAGYRLGVSVGDLKRPAEERTAKDGVRILNSQEAASLLGVTRQRMAKIASRGKIPVYQKFAGKAGSRLWFREDMVLNYSAQAERVRWRRVYDGARRHGSPITAFGDDGGGANGKRQYHDWAKAWTPPRFGELEISELDRRAEGKNTRRDYGEFYSTRQVALLLKVGITRVLELRRTGRLAGRQGPARYVKHKWRGREATKGRNRWFFRKDDVDALMADPEYCKRRRGYERSLTPEAAEERMVRRFPSEEEIWEYWKINQFGKWPKGVLGDTGWRWD